MGKCVQCWFFRSGECRRYPPVLVHNGQTSYPRYEQAHPKVADDHWCGEFNKRLSVPAAGGE